MQLHYFLIAPFTAVEAVDKIKVREQGRELKKENTDRD